MISKQLREADRKLTALEKDVKAVRLIQRMNRDEQEKLAMKLLLLKAQMILSRHGEFQAADEIGDFLSTPFATTEGEQVSCGGVEGTRSEARRVGAKAGADDSAHLYGNASLDARTTGDSGSPFASNGDSRHHTRQPLEEPLNANANGGARGDGGTVTRTEVPKLVRLPLEGTSGTRQFQPAGIHFASTTDEAQGYTSRVVAGENGADGGSMPPSRNHERLISPETFPRAHPSSVGNGVVFPARPQIHLCNKERRRIVRSAEERGK